MESRPWSTTLRRAVGLVLASVMIVAVGWLMPLEMRLTILAILTLPPALIAFPGLWWRHGPLPDARADIASRVPVWSALSDLYANLGLDDGDLTHIAQELAQSGYSVHQLEEILYREVHPVLVREALMDLLDPLGSFPGELGRFDAARLADTILVRDAKRGGVALVAARWVTRSEWRCIRKQLVVILAEGRARPVVGSD